ncbi:MAG: PQQ-binding-like beta-propeller repeat protein [Bdellovibrionales bacterium]|nr:PQQ-binding-like beta-propeller repeat protein [Bdellovibrionales bacterium]NQZ18484.1 PQQ-binding-like beta-propeller repeat protein [Bdellovibrionales bacterium]
MKFLFLIILFVASQAWSAPHLSREWSRSTLIKPHNSFRYFNRMPPVLVKNLVVQGNAIDGIKAFDRQSGNEKWGKAFKNGVEGGATTDGQKVFFGANNGQFYSVDAATGDVLWTFPLNSESLTQPTVHGSMIFHITGNNTLYAFDKESGQSLWVRTNSIKSTMTVRGQTSPLYDKGVVYAGFSDGNFAAFTAKNGRQLWSKRIGDDKKFNDVDASAKVTDKCVLVASYANSLYCLNKTNGAILWRHDVGGFNSVLVSDNNIFYPTVDGEIHVLDADSGKLLKKIVDIKGLATEVVALDKYLIYGESEGSIVVKDKKTLATIKEFTPGNGIFARPTVDKKNNEVYFFSNEANIFKLKLSDDKGNMFPWANSKSS